ncbi:hypothetical protein F5887DRAFT_1241057 [Amanita rubescens]|nr:hypothetical protein F5887DRAFT_1241057 [Amanita rubescens]
MRLLVIIVFAFSMLCSWFAINVLACENDPMTIVKRAGERGNTTPVNDQRTLICGPPSGQRVGQLMPKLKRRDEFPAWLLLKNVQKKTIFSKHACVLILKGTYTESHVKKYINPVVKVYTDQTEEDMKFILAEVSHLKQVGQYIDGVFEWPAGPLKMNVYLLMVNMGVALDPKIGGDRAKFLALGAKTREEYKQKYGMIHMDKYIANYANGPDARSSNSLRLLDWAHARYKKLPGLEWPFLDTFYLPGDRGGLPPPPKPIPQGLRVKDHVLLPDLEKFIIKDQPVHLWGNAEANYYKLRGLVDGFPAALKVFWVEGTRKQQHLVHEVTNLKAVERFLTGGSLLVNDENSITVVYLVVKFEGEMDVKGLDDQEREKLKQEAIERYKKDFGMVNTHPIDKYFTYGKDVDNKFKAYIYEWSSARHVDLPDGTLDYICPLPNQGHEDLRAIGKEYCTEDAALKSQHTKA